MVANAPLTLHEDFSLEYVFAETQIEPGMAVLVFNARESDDPARYSFIRSELRDELERLRYVHRISWPGDHTAELEIFVTITDRFDYSQRADSRAKDIVRRVRDRLNLIEEKERAEARNARSRKSQSGSDKYVNKPQLTTH